MSSIESSDILQKAIEKIEIILSNEYGMSKRIIATLILQDDEEIRERVKAGEPENYEKIREIVESTKKFYSEPLHYIINIRRQEEVNRILSGIVEQANKPVLSFKERLSRIMINPITGLPILLLILYFGIYKFVGEFGAGILVDFIEGNIFENYVNPWFVGISEKIIPWKILRELFTGEYGVITLGVRYAVALILPIVTTFFLAFAVIEDTGYLPRLSLLIDRLFKKIGLTGRAVIPIVLGLGCDTMATMVTRTLPTKRERLIATILLALAIPCSAQLGVILSLMEGNPVGLWIWIGVMSMVFLLIGFLSSKILPGDKPSFYMEIPPIRLPKLSNVLVKTYARVKWYFVEIFPIFIIASAAIWLGKLTGLFDFLVGVMVRPIRWMGLPDQTAVAFLFGFFRRDYGAAGLYDIKKAGLLDNNQLLVACVTLALFLPCIAQFVMNVKERGWKTGVVISAFILLFSFSVGYLVNATLNLFGIIL